MGLGEEDSKEGTRTILLAFNLINTSDMIRDEGLISGTRARLTRLLSSVKISPELKQLLGEINREAVLYEKEGVGAERYIERMSILGGRIFESLGGSDFQKAMLREAGKIISGATIVSDMIKDLQSDQRSGSFNPLRFEKNETINRIHEKYFKSFKELMDPVVKMRKEYDKKSGSLTREWIEDMCMEQFIGCCCP
jgi:hypothetical protein